MRFKHDYSAEYWRFASRLDHPHLADDFWRGFGRMLRRDWSVDRGAAAAIGKSLLGRMSDSRLRYHTPLHVLAVLSWADRHRIALAPWQELALWFHDAVYKPQSIPGDNESLSAMLARAMLTGFIGRDHVARVTAGVRATGLHLKRRVPPDCELIVDLDLCSFAWDRRNFLASSLALADELMPIVGPKRYRIGRRKFLEALTAKGFVYRSPVFVERFEPIAQANIADLLENEPDLTTRRLAATRIRLSRPQANDFGLRRP